MKNKVTKAAIIRVVGRVLQSEIANVCSDDFNSKSKHAIVNFKHTVKSINKEMKSTAPTLLLLLKACMKTKKPRANEDEILALIFSMICKHRRPSSCLFQRVISLALYGGHASKRVSIIVISLYYVISCDY